MSSDAWERFWSRHSNPKSGWSRLLTGPLLLAALYRRSWRLLAVAVGWTVLNPVAFGAPEESTDDWMHRGVRAERVWLEEGRPVFGAGYPEILNVLNLGAFAYTVYAALARKPARMALTYAVSVGLKFWFIEALIRWQRADDGPGL
ncbi:MAG: DUF6653 family protein [Natronomonas sp.]